MPDKTRWPLRLLQWSLVAACIPAWMYGELGTINSRPMPYAPWVWLVSALAIAALTRWIVDTEV